MRGHKIIFTLNIILTCFFTASAQTNELHIRLSSCHQKAMEHASNIQDIIDWSPEAFKNSYQEARMAYKDAIIQRIELKKSLIKTEEIKAYLKTMEMYHMKAYDHYSEMRTELSKNNYDKDMVKNHAKGFYQEINNAERIHQELQSNLNK